MCFTHSEIFKHNLPHYTTHCATHRGQGDSQCQKRLGHGSSLFETAPSLPHTIQYATHCAGPAYEDLVPIHASFKQHQR